MTDLFPSLVLGMILTHSLFWNDASIHSVLVKVNCREKRKGRDWNTSMQHVDPILQCIESFTGLL